jgi:hypothetical protein
MPPTRPAGGADYNAPDSSLWELLLSICDCEFEDLDHTGFIWFGDGTEGSPINLKGREVFQVPTEET